MDSQVSRKSAALWSVCLLFFAAGCRKTPQITLQCEAAPPAVFQGDSVTANATARSVSTKKHTNVLYSWTGAGVNGSGASARIDTNSLDPGTYTVKAEVKEGKQGKEGRKPEQTAQCSTNFRVKEFEPPTASCSGSPSILPPDGKSDITCTGVSPQNRPLTYSYSASAGTITGTGTAAVFSAAGAPTGTVTITCNVQDDKGHSASAETTLTIQAPPPPPVAHAQPLCSLSFERDTKRPTRVSNEAKACLDEIALDLNAKPDAKVVLVGDSNSKEKQITAKEEQRSIKHKKVKVEHFAEQRAVNAKDYLVNEKGIDPTRVAIATGTGDDQNVQDYLVPADASFSADVQGTTWINELAFSPQPRKPLPMRRRSGAPK